MDRLVFKKDRQHFETAPHPPHVTFDDGHGIRRNLPWIHFVEARWNAVSGANFSIIIGEWVIAVEGINLEPLFRAIEEATLLRVKAQPELAQDRSCDGDSIVTSIQFVQITRDASRRKGNSSQLDLEIGL